MTRLAKAMIVLLVSAPLIAAGAARAQNPFSPGNDFRDPATAIKFNLSTPGARSLAMGGAFLGLADDATAAYTNPAGLTNLALGGSEVAVELRHTEFTISFADQGHYPTNAGYPTFLTFIGQDSVDGLPRSEAENETTGLSFLSVGYVLPGGLTLAVYRHELANFRSGFESQGPFNDDVCFTAEGDFAEAPDTPPGDVESCNLFRVQPKRSNIDLEIVNYGVSAGYGFDLPPLMGLESNLSLGLGLSYYEVEFLGLRETFDLCRFDGPADFGCSQSRLPGGFYGPADFGPDNLLDTTTESADEQAFGVSVGFLWKLGRQQRWSVGGVFRQGPDFDTQQSLTVRSRVSTPDTLATRDVTVPLFDGHVTVPDVFGMGLAFRTASGDTKVTFDWNRVRYSQTLGDFTSSFDPDAEFVEFEIQDVDQVHLGLERTILVVESLFVGTARFGAWLEPFHEPEYIGTNGDRAALFGRPTDDEIHLSAGLGLVIKEDYQIDLAADFSDPTTTVSFSLVKFF